MRMMMATRVCAMVLAGVLLTSCSSNESVATAERQISSFRRSVAAQQYAHIYAASSDVLKKSTREEELVSLLSAVKRKLGDVKTSEKSGWSVRFLSTGTYVTLGYKTQFERGGGAETFVYQVSEGNALLAGYHINSNALITN